VIMLSTAFIPAVTAIPAASVATTEMQVCGGGDDGDLSINCKWKEVANCMKGIKKCAVPCVPCALDPSKLTCASCAICGLSVALPCLSKYCEIKW